MAELLNDNVLSDVNGGAGSGGRSAIAFYKYGVYWGSSDQSSGPYSEARNWSDLYVEYAAPGTDAPYCVFHFNVAIGWTTQTQFHYL